MSAEPDQDSGHSLLLSTVAVEGLRLSPYSTIDSHRPGTILLSTWPGHSTTLKEILKSSSREETGINYSAYQSAPARDFYTPHTFSNSQALKASLVVRINRSPFRLYNDAMSFRASQQCSHPGYSPPQLCHSSV